MEAVSVGMDAEQDSFLRLVAAFVRGRLMVSDEALVGQRLFAAPLDALTEDEMRELLRLGSERGCDCISSSAR